MSHGGRRLLRIAVIQLLAGLVWLLPVTAEPSGIPFWRGGEFSDLLISHWPNAWFIHRSLSEWRQLPLWNPMILAGAPFAADPLSGMWYPPTWLAVLFPAGLAFNLLLWLHLAWAGSGMWLLLERLGVAAPAALVGSLAWSGTPKLVGHVGLGHLGLVSAVSWTPWVLMAVLAAAEVPPRSTGEWARRSGLAGILLGLAFLADPRWAAPMGGLSLATATWWVAHRHKREQGQWGGLAAKSATALVFGLAVAAILALPLGEFTAHSTRIDLSPTESGSGGLPPAQTLGMLAPNLGGWPEWQAYAGITVLALSLVALWSRAPGAGFWAGLVVVCLVLAWGDATPIHRLLSRILPGYALLRVPARWLFGVAFGLAVLAGLGLNRLLDRPFDGQERARFNLTIFGLLGLLAGVGAVAWLAGGRAPALPYAISAAWLGAVALWMAPRRRPLLPARWLALGWAAMVAFDLALVDLSEVESRQPMAGPSTTVADLSLLHAQGEAERAFSPSYSLPQPDAALAGLQLADGINPLQLRGLRDYMADATGFSSSAYSVTLPPFPEGDPRLPWGAQPDAHKLGRLNVAYMASAYPIQQNGWGFVGVAGGAFLYRNVWSRPRAWVELGSAEGPWKAVTELEWSPNRIRLQADGPGVLVVSELAYPGWQIEVNGLPAEPAEGRQPLRAIRLPSGPQRVELVFRPWTVFVGAAITLVGLASVAAMWLIRP